MKHILYISPSRSNLVDGPLRAYLDEVKGPDTQVDIASLSQGPTHLTYYYYEALILLPLLHRVKQAEEEGYDAAVIGCFYDPGLREAREITERITVTGAAESSLFLAASLGYRFSILVPCEKTIPQMHENIVNYGLADRLASFESVDLGVVALQQSRAETESRLITAAQRAIHNKRAEVIILGCTREFGFYKKIQEELGVPVIDSIIAPLKCAELMIELRQRFSWSHSKACSYKSPPSEEVVGWGLQGRNNTDIWKLNRGSI